MQGMTRICPIVVTYPALIEIIQAVVSVRRWVSLDPWESKYELTDRLLLVSHRVFE